MRKGCLALLSAVCLVTASISCFADETEKDYSYLEEMSVKELKELDAAIHALLGNAETAPTETEVIEKETETVEEKVLMSEEDFFSDIVDSYNARGIVSGRYTASEENSMSTEEYVAHYIDCCETERPFYEKYKNATFDDLNIAYLCNQYINGLKKQYHSEDVWEETHDRDKFFDEYNSGFYNRAYVIVELSDYWNLPFGDVTSMREHTESLDSLNDAETRNSQVSHETVKEVQTLLHEIGFRCWNIDGVAGKRTVKAIKRFQEMYGYEIDGMIDNELIEQLKQVKADKGLDDEVETETE